MPTLSDEYLLVLLCISLAHDLGRGGACLKHFIDFRYTLHQIGNQLTSEGFWTDRREEKIDLICSEALGLVEAILPGSLPSSSIPIPAPSISSEQAWQLLSNPRKAFDNSLWMLRLHELWKPGNLGSFVRQNLSHPGRIPLCSFKLTRFAYRLAVRGAVAGLNRRAG